MKAFEPMKKDHLLYQLTDTEGVIQVWDNGERRLLSFVDTPDLEKPGLDEQSACLLSAPERLLFDYTQAMMVGLLLQVPRKALCLGLGAGSLVKALLAVQKRCQVVAVEKRQAVIEIAQQYFFLPACERLELHCADAEDFLATERRAYDLIFSDLYTAQGVAELQATPDFLRACRAHLKPGGWLVINGWREHQGKASMLPAVKAIFSEVLSLNTPEGNWIVFAGQQPLGQGRKLHTLASSYSQQLGYELWPYYKHCRRV